MRRSGRLPRHHHCQMAAGNFRGVCPSDSGEDEHFFPRVFDGWWAYMLSCPIRRAFGSSVGSDKLSTVTTHPEPCSSPQYYFII